MKEKTYKHVIVRGHKRSDTGKPYWIVEWRPERGRLRRRTFSDEGDARAEANFIEKLFSNGARKAADLPLQTMLGVVLMLEQIPHVPIHEIIQSYLQTHSLDGSSTAVGLKDAGEQYIESRSDPADYSLRQRQDVKNHIARLVNKLGSLPLSQVKSVALESYIKNEVGGAPRTRLNHVTTISAFGRWARTKKKWLPFNTPSVFEELQKPRCRTKNKEIFSPEELMRLLVFTPHELLPFVTIGAFGATDHDSGGPGRGKVCRELGTQSRLHHRFLPRCRCAARFIL